MIKRGEPVIWIDWLKQETGERLVSFSAFQALRKLPDGDKRHILQLLGGLYQLVYDLIEAHEPEDERLFDEGRKRQVWMTLKNKEDPGPRGET